ncbi:hypothetical protein B0H14DRAFT_2735017 [Mycena olivaceomarginata]|nr:hypothetical protein B0H14DRAFT_2735017 [Mycena olivaceomarginata]
MSTNVAIIDDRDPLLRYSTGWNNSGSFVEFAGTARWSGIPGSTASLAFSGSSVIIYGSVAANPSEASLSFSVDGSLAGSYSPSPSTTALHHQVLWASPPLHDETHILFMTQTTASESGSGVIFLDYIMYNTTSRPENTTFFIDDRDPQVVYTPAWRQFGSEGDFQHTSSESTVPGDAFTLEFEGTSISYYGGLTTSDTDTTIAEIVLDGGAPTMYTAPSKISATTNNLIYKSGELEAGNHTLVVTSTNSATLWADYFLVTASPGGSMQTESAPLSALPSSARSKSQPTIAAIIGAFLGALVVSVLLFLAVLLLIRRRRRARDMRRLTAPRALLATNGATSMEGDTHGHSRESSTASTKTLPAPPTAGFSLAREGRDLPPEYSI